MEKRASNRQFFDWRIKAGVCSVSATYVGTLQGKHLRSAMSGLQIHTLSEGELDKFHMVVATHLGNQIAKAKSLGALGKILSSIAKNGPTPSDHLEFLWNQELKSLRYSVRQATPEQLELLIAQWTEHHQHKFSPMRFLLWLDSVLHQGTNMKRNELRSGAYSVPLSMREVIRITEGPITNGASIGMELTKV